MPLHKRICPICEAACNLEVTVTEGEVVQCRGNAADTFSQGHICPKGVALAELHADPDRLRQPLVRNAAGALEPTDWATAYALVQAGLSDVKRRHGADAIATYIGNPTAHNIGLSQGIGVFLQQLGSRQVFSAGSVDQLPKQLASALMFGDDMAIPVPDIERTDCLVILGANPLVSNGSLWVVPGIRKKIRAMQARGGRLVVVDPRRSETAQLADQHLFIRPGSDAFLLAALAAELLHMGCVPRVPVAGLEQLTSALARISLEQAVARTGIAAEQIRTLARQLARADSAAIYGRVGTTLQQFGTLTSFLLEVVNILTGNLDRAGGAMFPQQAYAEPPRKTDDISYARYHSRVSGYPEVLGQMPVACLAEEIETPGAGQIRALVSVAGNPVVSNPESRRLRDALASLDFMVAVDIYHNETTQLADVILPGTSPFEEVHYDHFLGAMTYRNTARFSDALLACEGRPDEWQIMLQLAYFCRHDAVADAAELRAFEDALLSDMVSAYLTQPSWRHLKIDEVLNRLVSHDGVARWLDLGIRLGPWGDGFTEADGLTLRKLIEQPDSVDMGPLQPRLNEVLRGREVQMAPGVILDDLDRLRTSSDIDGLQLIGRRHIQTNNSWLHNLPLLSRGPDRTCLEMHPLDAEQRQIGAGDCVSLTSSVGTLQVQVQFSEQLMPGTVCLPHGFSEDHNPGQRVARSGPNSNAIAPADFVDALSGTVALNGIPVSVVP
ncbi:MAG: molybdopterin-dependent oxidoreductase [Pseudomonadota bacterium]